MEIGGRQKGSLNKVTLALQHRGNDLVELSSLRIKQILNDTLPCSVCRGAKKTLFTLPAGSHAKSCKAQSGGRCSCKGIGERPCASCNESGFEQLDPSLVGKVAIAVRGEAYPQLRAVEHSGSIDTGSVAATIRERRFKRNGDNSPS